MWPVQQQFFHISLQFNIVSSPPKTKAVNRGSALPKNKINVDINFVLIEKKIKQNK